VSEIGHCRFLRLVTEQPDWFHLIEARTRAVWCEDGDEHLGSIKARELFDKLSKYQLIKDNANP
jgi:hypothetical protein